MLTPRLRSLHQEYKKDTDAVAGYLASTAKALGDRPAVKSVRLKGKARVQAKKEAAAAAQGSQATSSVLPKAKIPVKEFVHLAELVATKSSPGSIPLSFRKTIRRAIKYRAQYSSELPRDGPTDVEGDQAHEHFVGILMQVEAILDPLVKEEETRPKQPVRSPPVPEAGDSSAASVSNRFEGLTVEESTEEPAEVQDFERPDTVKGDTVAYEAETTNTQLECLVRYFMMIADVQKIRQAIEIKWSQYFDELITLPAVAVATDTAISLVRSIVDELAPMFDQHGGVWVLAQNHLINICVKKSGLPPHPVTPEVQAVINGAMIDRRFDMKNYEAANHTFVMAYWQLRVARGNLDKDGLFANISNADIQLWDREGLPDAEKAKQDETFVKQIVDDLYLLHQRVKGYPAYDELLRATEHLHVPTTKIPFSAVFALQILLDIHHQEPRVEMAHNELMAKLAYIKEEAQRHVQYHESLGIPTEEPIKVLLDRVDMALRDPVFRVKKQIFRENWMDAPPPFLKHRLTKQSPVIAGILLFRFQAEAYFYGVKTMNHYNYTISAAHLYQALKNEGLLQLSWHDMDAALAIMREDTLFGQGQQHKAGDLFNRLMIQFGITVTALKKWKDPTRGGRLSTLASKAGARKIRAGIPITRMFVDRYMENSNQVNWTADSIKAILELSTFEVKEHIEGGELMRMGPISDKQKLRAVRTAADRKGKNRATVQDEACAISPSDLIHSLSVALHMENTELAFPYLRLHEMSWKFLTIVKEKCDPLLIKAFGENYLKDEDLSWVTAHVFEPAKRGDMQLMQMAADAAREGLSPMDKTQLLQLTGSINFFAIDGPSQCIAVARKMGLDIGPSDRKEGPADEVARGSCS